MSAKVYTTKKCVYCLDRRTTELLLPCHHQCLCNPCAAVLMGTKPMCPICRADVIKYTHSFEIEVHASTTTATTTTTTAEPTTTQANSVPEHIPVVVEVMETYQRKRDDYFKRARPIISYQDGVLEFDFDHVNGFKPHEDVVKELFAVLGYTKCRVQNISAYGLKGYNDENGERRMRGPGSSYTIILQGGAKPMSEEDLAAFVKNCAFQHYLSYKPENDPDRNRGVYACGFTFVN